MKGFGNKWMTILVNVLAWLVIFSLFLLARVSAGESLAIPKRLIFIFIILVAEYYSFYFYFTPKFFLQRKYWIFAFFTIAFMLFVGLLVSMNHEPLSSLENIRPGLDPELRHRFSERLERFPRAKDGMISPPVMLTILISGLTIMVSVIVRTTLHLSVQAKVRQDQINQQLETELTLLKNQVSPHFFFNTLNTIYALTDTDPKQAREVIHRLSKMMRYLLYESEKSKFVAIQKEVQLLETYIALMKSRLSENVKIESRFELLSSNFMVPPLLFIPLIENAFKHGVSSQSVSKIDVELVTETDQLTFKCVNNVIAKNFEEGTGGIGLQNVKRRLALLYPKDAYHFLAEQQGQQFVVELMIKK